MQSKKAFIVCAMATFLSFEAMSQSSHDAISGPDPDLSVEAGKAGKFEILSPGGKFRLGIRGHLQENNEFTYIKSGEKKDINIELKRARLSIYGDVLHPSLTYLFQLGYELPHQYDEDDDSNNYKAPGSDYLRDYYLNWAGNVRYAQLRIGKFRTPFSRQQLMSTTQMQFYDQSEANNQFQLTDSGRDVGIMAHNGFYHPFEWALAAVSHGLVGRIGYNHNNIDGYDFVDWKGTGLRFAVAANGFLHLDYKTAGVDDIRAGADFVAKAHRFSTNGAFYFQTKTLADKTSEHRFGAGLDLGYLIRGNLEPVGRYSWTKMGKDSPNAHEILLGLNYYIYGHHLKLQGYGGLNLANSDWTKWMLGLQIQFAT
jgi:hypothetical protein